MFDPLGKKLYKVIDLKNDENGRTSWAKLVLNSGEEQREISDAAELDEFRDYLLLNLVVSPDK